MDSKIKKYSIINFVGAILLCVFKIIQNSFSNGDNHVNRRIVSLIGLFFTIPTLIASFITFVLVWEFYIERKFKYNFKYLYYTIPFLFIIIGLIYFIFSI